MKINLTLEKTAYTIDQLVELSGPVVLFLGRSNAGKSSLLNALTGKKLAQVSKNPGKTRSINYYRYGKKLSLVDLPGYGYAKRSHAERDQWGELIHIFFERLSQGALAFLLIDAKRSLESEEVELVQSLQQHGHEVRVLLTKSDRLSQSDRQKCLRSFEQDLRTQNLQTLYTLVSAKNREGLGAIRHQLYEYEKGYDLPSPQHEKGGS